MSDTATRLRELLETMQRSGQSEARAIYEVIDDTMPYSEDDDVTVIRSIAREFYEWSGEILKITEEAGDA